MSAGADAVSEDAMVIDKEVDTLMAFAVPAAKVADETCALPPSPPVDADQNLPLLSKSLPSDCHDDSNGEMADVSHSSSYEELSVGYHSCSSSVLAPTDETPNDVHLVSAASKYRLRCQCGTAKCRQYLY